jgi:hypothetical protein
MVQQFGLFLHIGATQTGNGGKRMEFSDTIINYVFIFLSCPVRVWLQSFRLNMYKYSIYKVFVGIRANQNQYKIREVSN